MQPEQIVDLVNGTLRRLGRGRATNLMTDRRMFYFLPLFLRTKKVTERGGTALQWTLFTANSGQAEHVDMDAVDTVTIRDISKKAVVDWRNTRVPYAWDLREFSMNAGDENVIFDLIESRRMDAWTSLAEKFEAAGWSKPDDSTDEVTPYGIKMYIVPGFQGAAGFTGRNPAGFPNGVAGIDSTTNPRWRNYSSEPYDDVTPDDAIDKMKDALTYTNFKSPVRGVPDYRKGRVQRGIYAGYPQVKQVEKAAEQQNDRLGKDVDSMHGITVVRRVPLYDVPELEAQADTNFYGVDWSVMEPVFLRGWFLRETKPIIPSNQHTKLVKWVDNTWNLRCFDRRSQWIVPAA